MFKVKAYGLLQIAVILLMGTLISCSKESLSPGQSESFFKLFGSYLKDTGYDVKTLPDGGYVIVGTITSEQKGKDIALIRTDKYGNQFWEPRLIGAEGEEEGFSIELLDDGGFIMVGSVTTEEGPGQASTDMFIVRTNGKGETLWTKRYGGPLNEVGYNVKSTSDGGFIFIGSTESYGLGGKDVWLVKTNDMGDTLWTRTHGGSGDDVGKSIIETSYGYIYTGYTKSYSGPGQSNANIFVVRVNPFGKEIYPFTYGGQYDDMGETIIAHPEGGYIVCGTTGSEPSGLAKVTIFRVDEDISNVFWSGTYGGQAGHIASSLKLTPDNGYIVSGTIELSPSNQTVFLLKTDNEGNEQYIKTFGGTGLQRGEAVDVTPDGGFVITGSNEFEGNSMITLIKTMDEY